MLDFLNDVLWSYVLIYGLIAAGLAFTIFSRFVQYNNYIRSRERVDVLIQPPLHKYPVYKLHNAQALLDEGERAAREALPQLRMILEDAEEPVDPVE